MSDKQPCERCGAMILPATAERTGGLCMPCVKDTHGKQSWIRLKPSAPQVELRTVRPLVRRSVWPRALLWGTGLSLICTGIAYWAPSGGSELGQHFSEIFYPTLILGFWLPLELGVNPYDWIWDEASLLLMTLVLNALAYSLPVALWLWLAQDVASVAAKAVLALVIFGGLFWFTGLPGSIEEFWWLVQQQMSAPEELKAPFGA